MSAGDDVTEREWREAVGDIKWSMYMAMSCSANPAALHDQLLKLLDDNPRLKGSKFGKRYLAKTKHLRAMLDAHGRLEDGIETTLDDALRTTQGMKYWRKRHDRG